jgi:hypothetical protein
VDQGTGRSLPSAMARRNVFDPLEPTREPRWYAIRNMQQCNAVRLTHRRWVGYVGHIITCT